MIIVEAMENPDPPPWRPFEPCLENVRAATKNMPSVWIERCVCDLRDRLWNGYGKCLRCSGSYTPNA